MEVNRRTFLRTFRASLAAAILLASPAKRLLEKTVFFRRTRALPGKAYPGGVKRLRGSEISKTSRWAG